MRELEEEIGIRAIHPRQAVTADIVGDSCSSAADAHVWHVYVESYRGDNAIEVKEEGSNPVWLTLDEVQSRDLTFAIRYLLEYHKDAITSS